MLGGNGRRPHRLFHDELNKRVKYAIMQTNEAERKKKRSETKTSGNRKMRLKRWKDEGEGRRHTQ
jgi:hypothetical protein